MLTNKVVNAYRCPDEPSTSQNTGMGARNAIWGSEAWAAGNYGANYLVFGNPPAKTTEGARLMSSITDGTSNTIFFAERYAICSMTGNENSQFTLSNLWADSNGGWRPAFCLGGRNASGQEIGDGLSAPPTPLTSRGGYVACDPFQVAPDWLSACDYRRAQSPHVGGINVGMGDGGVQFISKSVSDATWYNLCDPRDGFILGGNDW